MQQARSSRHGQQKVTQWLCQDSEPCASVCELSRSQPLTKLITSRRIIFTPATDLKQELSNTAIQITCYDRDGNVLKRVTSTDDGTVEDPEGDETGTTDGDGTSDSTESGSNSGTSGSSNSEGSNTEGGSDNGEGGVPDVNNGFDMG